MKNQLLALLIFSPMALGSSPLAAQTFSDIAVSTSSVCGLLDNGDVDCSTRNREVSPERYAPPSDLPKMAMISSGEQHSCGIDLAGAVICWGGGVTQSLKDSFPYGYFDQLNVPVIDQPLISITSGTHHSCALDVNNKAWCWGLNVNRQAEPPGDGLGSDGSGYVMLDAGGNFTCGLQTGGNIECWSTDERIARQSLIEGPFVDMDVNVFNACGLKADGTIDCWLGRRYILSNGPYTDLVTSYAGVCGLNLNQILECKGSNLFNEKLPVFSSDSTFTKIESAATYVYGELPFCGLSTNGEIECSEQFDDFVLPGASDNSINDLSDLQLPLVVRRYSKNQIELFWAGQNDRFGKNALQYEIYKNDVLVDTTSNSSSWYDGESQIINPVSYRIRAVDGRGRLGPFTKTILVDNETGTISQGAGGTTNFDFVTPEHTVVGLKRTFIGSTPYIVWSGSTPGTNGLKGYEVRVDNKVISYSDGFSVAFDDYVGSNCYQLSVAAMSFDDKIIDYSTVVLNRKSSNQASCQSR